MIPGQGSSPEEGNGNLLQYSCVKIPMDRGAWWATWERLLLETQCEDSNSNFKGIEVVRASQVVVVVKNPPTMQESICNAGNPGLIPGSRGSSGKRNGNLLQYFCLENGMDRGVWQATARGVAKSRT